MPSKPQPIFRSKQKILANLGKRIRLACLRRGLSAEVVAERSSISRMTLIGSQPILQARALAQEVSHA